MLCRELRNYVIVSRKEDNAGEGKHLILAQNKVIIWSPTFNKRNKRPFPRTYKPAISKAVLLMSDIRNKAGVIYPLLCSKKCDNSQFPRDLRELLTFVAQ